MSFSIRHQMQHIVPSAFFFLLLPWDPSTSSADGRMRDPVSGDNTSAMHLRELLSAWQHQLSTYSKAAETFYYFSSLLGCFLQSHSLVSLFFFFLIPWKKHTKWRRIVWKKTLKWPDHFFCLLLDSQNIITTGLRPCLISSLWTSFCTKEKTGLLKQLKLYFH